MEGNRGLDYSRFSLDYIVREIASPPLVVDLSWDIFPYTYVLCNLGDGKTAASGNDRLLEHREC